MTDPVAGDGSPVEAKRACPSPQTRDHPHGFSSARRRHLRLHGGGAAEAAGQSAPPATAPDDSEAITAAALLDRLAASLREVRGYVPNHIWWDAGAAEALIEYQARHNR